MFSDEKRKLSAGVKQTNTDLVNGNPPPYDVSADLPMTVRQAIRLESDIITDAKQIIGQNLGNPDPNAQKKVQEFMDYASSSVQSLHDIVEAKLEKQKGKQKDIQPPFPRP